jgi:hypothetical protein
MGVSYNLIYQLGDCMYRHWKCVEICIDYLMLSFGLFPGVCSLNANVPEQSVPKRWNLTI